MLVVLPTNGCRNSMTAPSKVIAIDARSNSTGARFDSRSHMMVLQVSKAYAGACPRFQLLGLTTVGGKKLATRMTTRAVPIALLRTVTLEVILSMARDTS